MLNTTFGFIILTQILLFGTVDRIQKALEKKEYEKVAELILKGLEKEPNNPGISYYQAKVLFDPLFYSYSIDSARIVAAEALIKFESADEDLRQELNEDGITIEKIQQLADQIRDQIFIRTLDNLSSESARNFQQLYPNSIYDEVLTYKIDSIEYLNATKVGTQSAYLSFAEKNPTSVFKVKADSALDYLRVGELKKRGTLQDYVSFLRQYPLTDYRPDIESYILKVSTASGESDRLIDFLRTYEVAELKKKAADVLFYSSGKQIIDYHPYRDSIQRERSLGAIQLLPVVENNFIGFYDNEGRARVIPAFTGIPDDYRCALIADDWIFAKNDSKGLIITKTGKPILEGVENYVSIAPDLGLVQMINGKWLYHKSGFKIVKDSIADAHPLGDHWIKIKKNGMWGLVTRLGLAITESIYDDIYRLGNFYVFEKDSRLAVYTRSLILQEVEDKGLSLEFKFDDIELVNEHSLIGFRDNRECLLDSSLNFLIPWGEYEIYPEASGWYLKSDRGYRLYNPSEQDIMDQHYPYLESNDGWLAIKTATDWMLLPRAKGLLPSRSYDSIKLINDHAVILITGENKELLFTSGTRTSLADESISAFANKADYLLLKNEETSKLYNREGIEILSNDFQEISFLSDTLIKVQVRGKQGLIRTNGEWILSPVFDGLDQKDDLVLTLIDGKIGCYDPRINELLEADYESRLTRIKDYYLAKKNGQYGIIDSSGEEIISFNYDEIILWNDTSYLTRTGQQYAIIDADEEHLSEAMESVTLLVQNDQQEIYRYISDGRYGLISNKSGVLLKPEFTDIFNIGSQQEPLFFADQHLSKAGFHVVSYVNENGELLLSKAYRPEEFDKILCDD